MNFEELDVALEELESRLERLRALYEQYFLGFEKIEPQVARKDVDRRIYVLRREKIRNTGKRFKLQTIIQRYNTFQQYWQRICREIENGTYKRHLARAERIMGPGDLLTIAARRRFGKATVEKLAATAAANAAANAAVDDTSPLDEIDADDIDDALPFPPGPGTDRAPLPAIPRSSTPSRLPMPPTSLPPNAPSLTARPSRYESLTLDMDLDSWDPERSIRSRHRGSAPKAAPAPAAPVPVSPIEAKPRIAPEPARPKSSPTAASPPRPSSRVPPPKPASRVPPPKPASRVPPPRSVSPPREPPPARPAAPARLEKPAPPPNASALSDERIKELHEKLVRTKRDNKEAGQVSVESLAKTLRATEEKLRAEHKNRKIEFEIVLRDGKTVVKPKVR